jgi:HAD superfamily hydrolase (TIGR01509 family)
VIKGLYFDGDQTLWDFDVMMRQSLSATLTHLKYLRPEISVQDLEIDKVIADREAVGRDLQATEMDLGKIRQAAFSRTLTRVGLPHAQLSFYLNDYYLKHRFNNVELFPEVIETLSDLGQSYALGFLSNGNSHPDRMGLGGLFTSVVLSQDYGVAKPDHKIFEIAAANVGCAPAELVMIGDSITNDIQGAQNAGWQGVWLNREGLEISGRHMADAEISSLLELPKVLSSLDGR